MQSKILYLTNKNQTKLFATKVAKMACRGDVISLTGNLGAGKTSFVQYFVNSLSKDKIEVTSPTFNLLHIYNTNTMEIWHFDLYRLKHKKEVYELGVEDAFHQGISSIEWPEIIQDILPEERLEINIDFDKKDNNPTVRTITLNTSGKWTNL